MEFEDDGICQEELEALVFVMFNELRNLGVGATVVFQTEKLPYMKSINSDNPSHDYFHNRLVNVLNGKIWPSLCECLSNVFYNDGVIVVDPKTGRVMQSDGYLTPLVKRYLNKRGKILDENNKPITKVSKQFGFEGHAATRHIYAKAYSWQKGVVIMTLSQDTGCIRVFDRGYTVYSDNEAEVEKIPVSKEPQYASARTLDKVVAGAD